MLAFPSVPWQDQFSSIATLWDLLESEHVCRSIFAHLPKTSYVYFTCRELWTLLPIFTLWAEESFDEKTDACVCTCLVPNKAVLHVNNRERKSKSQLTKRLLTFDSPG
jgi:hypothetical protein